MEVEIIICDEDEFNLKGLAKPEAKCQPRRDLG